MAGSIDPIDGSTGWALTSHGIAEKLFTVGKDGRIVAQVAQSVRELDSFAWEVTLKADLKFSEGTHVTADNVALALTRLNQNNSGARASLGSMTITPLDNLRLKIQSERTTPVMEAVLAEWPFVVHLKKDGEYFFTGPFAIEKFVKDDRIELVPNPHYPNAAFRPLLVIQKFSDGQSLATALEEGTLDLAFHLPVDALPKLRQKNDITVKSFLVGYQYMMWYNTRNPQLADVNVRNALDIALDRHELTQEVRAGKPTRSFFPQNTPYYLEKGELHANRTGAVRLLDEAGWVKGASGERKKDAAPLTLKVVAYPQRPALVTMLPAIKRAFESLDISVQTQVTSGDNWDELDEIMAAKDFDLLLWAQHTLPAGDPQFFVNHFFRSDSAANHAGLNSPKIDGMLDVLSHPQTGPARETATAAVHQAIRDEVPVSILMTPSWHVGMSSRLAHYEPWGSDYYVIHGDFGIVGAPTVTTILASTSTTMATSTLAPVTDEGAKAEGDVNSAYHAPTMLCHLAFWCMFVLG